MGAIREENSSLFTGGREKGEKQGSTLYLTVDGKEVLAFETPVWPPAHSSSSTFPECFHVGLLDSLYPQQLVIQVSSEKHRFLCSV